METKTYTRDIKKIGEVKSYYNKFRKTSETKYFVVFNESKSMFPAHTFNLFQVGDTIEFLGHDTKEWINVEQSAKFQVKVIATSGTTTTSVTSTTTSTTTEEPAKEEAQLEVNYMSHPKPNKNGKMFTMARNLKGQPAEGVYIPLFAIPNDLHEAVLAGYGTLRAEGNLNDKTFFVTKVLSFEPTLQEEVSEVELKNVRFGLYHLSFTDKDGKRITIPYKEVPFTCSPAFESIKSEFKGTIKVKGGFRKVGKMKKDKATGEWTEEISWVDNEQLIYDFSNIDTDNIKRLEIKHVADLEYAKLLAMLKSNPAFTSFSGIKTLFASKGLTITTQQIEELFWDEKYDKEFYNTLKKKCSEIFVSEEEFVFVMIVDDLQFYIVERPVTNSATYIFNDSCDKDLLLDRLHQTRKFDIIRNSLTSDGKSLQLALGYKGRVVHQDHDEWLRKIQVCIGDGIERELIDRFVW